MSSMHISNQTVNTLKKLFSEGKRFDGRKLDSFRNISVEIGIANTAEGSARVKIGKTEVLAGVKMSIGAPYPDSPAKGNLMVSGDLLPIASPRVENGPPKFTAIEIPRLVDRVIRESHMIELDKLCIKEGEKVWTVIVDVYPMNDDGNLIDAATIAATIALKNAKLPALDSNGKVDYDLPSTGPLPLRKGINPLTFSFFKLGNSLILDPTREEEEACETRVSWGMSLWEGKHVINSAQKNGEVVFSAAEIESMMALLPKKFDEITEKIKNYL